MTGGHLPVLLAGALALLAVLLCCWQLLVSRRLKHEIAQLRQQLADKPANDKAAPADFSASLHSAERQQLQSAQPAPPRNSADKYRYVGSLAAQGLDAKGIAEALQLSTAEVEQLLQLAKLRQV